MVLWFVDNFNTEMEMNMQATSLKDYQKDMVFSSMQIKTSIQEILNKVVLKAMESSGTQTAKNS